MAGSRNFTNKGRGEGLIMLLAIYITGYEVMNPVTIKAQSHGEHCR
jgi:hypothetical protein